MDAKPRDTRPVPILKANAPDPADISQAHTTLLRPSRSVSQAAVASPAPPVNPVISAAYAAIERHADEAKLWRDQAALLVQDVKHDMNRFARAVDRWQRLMDLSSRTVVEDAELAAIERDLPVQAQRMARAHERWTACLAAARDHEDAAEKLRTTPSR